jgi:hypothetical protein
VIGNGQNGKSRGSDVDITGDDNATATSIGGGNAAAASGDSAIAVGDASTAQSAGGDINNYFGAGSHPEKPLIPEMPDAAVTAVLGGGVTDLIRDVRSFGNHAPRVATVLPELVRNVGTSGVDESTTELHHKYVREYREFKRDLETTCDIIKKDYRPLINDYVAAVSDVVFKHRDPVAVQEVYVKVKSLTDGVVEQLREDLDV